MFKKQSFLASCTKACTPELFSELHHHQTSPLTAMVVTIVAFPNKESAAASLEGFFSRRRWMDSMKTCWNGEVNGIYQIDVRVASGERGRGTDLGEGGDHDH